ncbi:MAG: hypothetical protein LBV52_02375 [Spirochaetaceae bacterium]|nr:hypothetical protein [Spirochaetaceae bacterium]
MKKIWVLTAAAFFIFLSACDSGGEISAANGQEEKINTTQTNITVTFVNSWADIDQSEFPDDYRDDPLTGYGATVDVSPAVLRCVVDTEELNNYNEDKANFDRIDAAWRRYNEELAEWDGITEETLPVAPTEDRVSEPVYPTVTLPYFPGTPFTNSANKETVFGTRPSWDYHYLAGWDVLSNYPPEDGDPAPYELTLQTPLTTNVFAVPKWAPVPADVVANGPFVTVTFEKNDGSGLADIKFAENPNITYYEADNYKFKLVDFGEPVNGIYRTIDTTYAKRDADGVPILVGYDGFIIQNFSEPVNTRQYYRANGWKTALDPNVAMTIVNLPTLRYSGNTFIYQKWADERATIHFNTNEGNYPGLIVNPVSDIIGSQPIFAQSGIKGINQNIPRVTTTSGIYSFTRWTTNSDGTGTTIGSSSKIKDSEITLYAQYSEIGCVSVIIPYTGRAVRWIAPIDVSYTFSLSGARGGATTNAQYAYGKGGNITATAELQAGTVLYLYVGGSGKSGNSLNRGGTGGWNGGGNGSSSNANSYGIGGAGGGATDVRTVAPRDFSKWDTSLDSRILVAGGGGGAVFTSFMLNGFGYSAGNGAAGIGNGGAGEAYELLSGGAKGTIRGSSSGGGLTAGAGHTAGAGANGTVGLPTWVSTDLAEYYSGSGGGGGGYYGASAASPSVPGAGGSSWAVNSESASTIVNYQIRKIENGREVFENHSDPIRFIVSSAGGSGSNDGDGKIVITYSLIPAEEVPDDSE